MTIVNRRQFAAGAAALSMLGVTRGTGARRLPAAPGQAHRALCAGWRHRRVLTASRRPDGARVRPDAGDRQSRRRCRHLLAPAPSPTRRATATPSAWSTPRSSPIPACSRTSSPTTPGKTSFRCRCCRARSLCWAVHSNSRRSKREKTSSNTPRPIRAGSSPLRRRASAPEFISPASNSARLPASRSSSCPIGAVVRPRSPDFIAGKVDFTFGAVPSIKAHIEGGKARGLGVTRGRAPQLRAFRAWRRSATAAWTPQRNGPGRPGIDARADRREAATHFSKRRERPGVPRQASGARLSADRHNHRRIPRPCRPGDRQVGQDHRGRQHQAGIAAIAAATPFRIHLSNSPRSRAKLDSRIRRASSPLLFGRRGGRRHFPSLTGVRERSAGTARVTTGHLYEGARVPCDRHARLPALHRGDFGPDHRTSWPGPETCISRYPGSIGAALHPDPSSH